MLPQIFDLRQWLRLQYLARLPGDLIAAIREAVGRERLFIAIDHKGGRVCRTPSPIMRYACARDWALKRSRRGEAAEVGSP